MSEIMPWSVLGRLLASDGRLGGTMRAHKGISPGVLSAFGSFWAPKGGPGRLKNQ